ncbi:MAG: hypothetical protein NTY22_08195, partial [Proteobacteria bacterium]|nr:hypothetical protein [Pseudomonadota bacterium]
HLDAIYSLERLLKKYPNPKYDVQFGLFIAAYYYYLDEWKYKLERPPAVDINNQKLLTVVTMNMYCTAGTINYYIGDLKK